jgi:hypothetical protein
MTQNASFPPNITTMEDLPKDDNFHNFQRGLELFNDTELPPSLPSSCLALVTEQEFHSNPATNIISSSLTKQETFTAWIRVVSRIHALHAVFHFPETKCSRTVNPGLF